MKNEVIDNCEPEFIKIGGIEIEIKEFTIGEWKKFVNDMNLMQGLQEKPKGETGIDFIVRKYPEYLGKLTSMINKYLLSGKSLDWDNVRPSELDKLWNLLLKKNVTLKKWLPFIYQMLANLGMQTTAMSSESLSDSMIQSKPESFKSAGKPATAGAK